MKTRFKWSGETVIVHIAPSPEERLQAAVAASSRTMGDFVAGIAHLSNMKKRSPLCALTLVDKCGICHRMDRDQVLLNVGQGDQVFLESPQFQISAPRNTELQIGQNPARCTTVAMKKGAYCGEQRGIAFFVCGLPERDPRALLFPNDFLQEEFEAVASALGRVKALGVPIRSIRLTILALFSFLLGLLTLVAAVVIRVQYGDTSGIDPIGAVSTALTVVLAALGVASLLGGPHWSISEVVHGIRWSQTLEDVVCNGDFVFADRLAMYVERLTGPYNCVGPMNTTWFRHRGIGHMALETPLKVIHLLASRCAIVAIRQDTNGNWLDMWPVFLDLRGQNALVLHLRKVRNLWYIGEQIRDIDWTTAQLYEGCLPAFFDNNVA
ncbi:hypothetical protein HDU93_007306 [Gonapodya sp. JEL0774]|nr:hypothetical protein HDU93_007306 [Gonapodya sp. JEL0774]